jgi:hypothetical protein
VKEVNILDALNLGRINKVFMNDAFQPDPRSAMSRRPARENIRELGAVKRKPSGTVL